MFSNVKCIKYFDSPTKSFKVLNVIVKQHEIY